MLPGHANEILECLSKYPLEVLGWITASAIPLISLSVVITRYLNEREKAILQGQIKIQDATVEAVKAKYEALIAVVPRQTSNNSPSLVLWLVAISLLIGAGAGALAIRLYDSRRMLTETARLQEENKKLADKLSEQGPVVSIIPDKVFQRIFQHPASVLRQLDQNLELPVVLFDGGGNGYKFQTARGKTLHVKADLMNRQSKVGGDKTDADSSTSK